jgi:hypothetical protein
VGIAVGIAVGIGIGMIRGLCSDQQIPTILWPPGSGGRHVCCQGNAESDEGAGGTGGDGRVVRVMHDNPTFGGRQIRDNGRRFMGIAKG